VPIPFYGRDGEHVITPSIELDAGGQPPSNAEVIGPDDTVPGFRCCRRAQQSTSS
jgi:hypothetical protein